MTSGPGVPVVATPGAVTMTFFPPTAVPGSGGDKHNPRFDALTATRSVSPVPIKNSSSPVAKLALTTAIAMPGLPSERPMVSVRPGWALVDEHDGSAPAASALAALTANVQVTR